MLLHRPHTAVSFIELHNALTAPFNSVCCVSHLRLYSNNVVVYLSVSVLKRFYCCYPKVSSIPCVQVTVPSTQQHKDTERSTKAQMRGNKQ